MPKLAAIVLAAGASKRFGAENKLLARLGARPLVRCVVEEIAREVADVVVVTGCDQSRIKTALAGLPARFVHNAAWQSGMGSSIAAGIEVLAPGIDGAFIVPGDMPFLNHELLSSLVAAFERHDGRAIVYPATMQGAQRNPVLWPRRFFAALLTLGGTEGGKALLQSLERECVAVPASDSSVFADVDTLADLEAASTST